MTNQSDIEQYAVVEWPTKAGKPRRGVVLHLTSYGTVLVESVPARRCAPYVREFPPAHVERVPEDALTESDRLAVHVLRAIHEKANV